MPEIRFFDGNPPWDGITPNGAAGFPNHESSLSRDEMRVLVRRILDIPGMAAPPDEMDAVFKSLSEHLRNADVIVKKGIHQRDTDVHFTINVYPEPGGAYHVWLAVDAARTVNVPTAPSLVSGQVGLVPMFRYKPAGITHGTGAAMKKWPAQFVYSEGNMPIGRPRGNSISVGNIATIRATGPAHAPGVRPGLVNPPPPNWQPPTV